jgi:hypothetical protein
MLAPRSEARYIMHATIIMIKCGTMYVITSCTTKRSQNSMEAMTVIHGRSAWDEGGKTKHGKNVLITLGNLILMN